MSGAEAVPGLRRDDDPGAAAGDDVAELLQHERGAVQVDCEDRRRRGLAGRDAGGVDEAGDVAEPVAVSTSAWTDSRDDTSTVAVLTSNPASRSTSAAASAFSWRRSASTTCLPALDPPRDGLTDRSCPDDDNDFTHGDLLSCRLRREDCA